VAAPKRDLARQIERLERRWMDAVRDRDMAFLEELLGEEFTLTTGRPGAPVRAREEWLAITRERYAIEEFEFEDLEVLPYGHVAVARSRYRQRATMDGEDRAQAYLMTDVFVRRKGRWQAVTRHISPLPPDSGS
jgi:ketosteroid isomerase-like protein